MYYWNVALSEHCEEVPLECGSVHWNTEEVCEVAPFTQCHCWDEEAAQFRLCLHYTRRISYEE